MQLEVAGRALRATYPDRVLVDGPTQHLKRDRGARVYVDCGPQTVASAYAIRPGGLVSAPVAWDDLDDDAPVDFTVRRFAP